MISPPDIQLPPNMTVWPIYLLWPMRIERLAIEFKTVFNRGARRQRLAAFEKKWSIELKEDLAVRLAATELTTRYGPARSFRAVQLRCLPPNMAGRAEIYQLNAEWQNRIDAYRAKFGLPAREQFYPPAQP